MRLHSRPHFFCKVFASRFFCVNYFSYISTVIKTKQFMTMQSLLEEAKYHYFAGYSQSRVVDFVYENAKNDTQATKILRKIFG